MQKKGFFGDRITACLIIICMLSSYLVTLSSFYTIYAAKEDEQIVFETELTQVSKEGENTTSESQVNENEGEKEKTADNTEKEENLQVEETESKNQAESVQVEETEAVKANEEETTLTDEVVEANLAGDAETSEENISGAALDSNSQATIAPTEETQEKKDNQYILKIKVGVKEKGYLKDEKIEIEDVDNQIFTLGQPIDNPIIQSYKDGVIKLNTIDQKDEYTIEIPLEIKKNADVSIFNIQNGTKVKLSGTYVDDDAVQNKVEKENSVFFEIENERQIEIKGNTEKYIKYTQDEKQFALMQMKVTIEEKNQDLILPVKKTNLKISLPEINVEEGQEKPEVTLVNIMPLNTGFTNGKNGSEVIFTEENCKIEDNKIVNISLENTEENGKYRQTNGKDEYIIEVIYNNAQNINVESVKAQIESNIEVFNKRDTKEIKNTQDQEYSLVDINSNSVSYEVKALTESVGKGPIYANVNREDSEDQYEIFYQNEVSLNISRATSVKNIEIKEQDESYYLEDGSKASTQTEQGLDSYYKTTIIKKENLVNILGENGSLEIIDEKGESLITINKDTEAGEDGNISLNYTNDIGKIIIRINNPEKEGILNFKNTKGIAKSKYTKESLNLFKGIIDTYLTTAELSEGVVTELGTKEIKIPFTETSTKATLGVSRNGLSTIVKNEDVQFNINLNNSNYDSDMYVNPEFKIILPEGIESANIKEINLLYGNGELKILDSQCRLNEDGRVEIYIKLEGTQKTFSLGDTNAGTTIVVNTDLSLDMYTSSKEVEAELVYVNPNVVSYESENENGIAKEKLQMRYVAPDGVVAGQKITGYEDGKSVMSMNQGEKVDTIKELTDARTINNELVIINNSQEAMQNPVILGRTAFKGNKGLIDNKNLGTTIDLKMLGSITDTNGNKEIKVYYSENGNATSDLNNEKNGWVENVENFENIKSYLIIPTENIEANEILVLNYQSEIPSDLILGTKIYSTFGVYYDNDIAYKLSESDKVGLVTKKIEDKKDETSNIEEETKEDINTEEDTNKNTKENTEENKETNENTNNTKAEFVPVKHLEENERSEETAEKKSVIFYDEVRNENNEEIDVTNVIKGQKFQYKMSILSMKNEPIKNMKVNIDLPDGFNINNAYYYLDNGKSMLNISGKEFNVDTVEDNIKVVLEITVDKDFNGSSDSKIALKVKADNIGREEYSKTKKYNVLDHEIDVKYGNVNENEFVKVGDEVNYKLTVKNISDKPISNISFSSQFPEELELSDVELVKGDYKTSGFIVNNHMNITQILDVGENLDLNIKATVKDVDKDDKRVGNYINIETLSNEYRTETVYTTIQKNYQVTVNEPTQEGKERVSTNVSEDTTQEKFYKITGKAFLDKNRNSCKDSNEMGVENIVVELYDGSTNQMVNKIVTNGSGEYVFSQVPNGKYYLKYKYDKDQYRLSDYKKGDVLKNKTSDAILINDEVKTDIIIIEDSSYSNIDIGLIDGKMFDFSLSQTISQITLQNKNGTKVVDGKDATLAKVEIKPKDISSSTVYVEYRIKVTNNGEIPGTINKIVDYLPEGVFLNTEINKDWYIGSDGNAYTESLAKNIINPGETREITLILQKQMTDENTGVCRNSAEIAAYSNELGLEDVDSIPGNKASDEDDFGTTDALLSVTTGGTTMIGVMVIITVLINVLLLVYVIKRKIDKESEVIL